MSWRQRRPRCFWAIRSRVDRRSIRGGLKAIKVMVMARQSDEETHEPLIADARNFYKVEKWTKDGAKVDHMLYAGSSLDKAREVFAEAIYHRPRIRLTIRQRTRVLEQWPVTPIDRPVAPEGK
jgi:hypothetical protein